MCTALTVALALSASRSSLAERLLWAKAQTNIEFGELDAKFFALRSGVSSGHGLDYSFRPYTEKAATDCAVYLVVFQDLDDYIAVVPKEVLDAFTDLGYGVAPLMSEAMTWAFPFMVADKHLGEALSSLMATKSGSSTLRPKIMPVANPSFRSARSIALIERLWNDINSSGTDFEVEMNVMAPLICDFVLKLSGLSDLLRIEHKCASPTDLPFLPGRYSPFAPLRLWHFVIGQWAENGSEGQCGFFCVARHFVRAEWSEWTTIPLDIYRKHTFTGPNALSEVLSYIAANAQAAVERANEVLQSFESNSIDPVDLLCTNVQEDEEVWAIEEDLQDVQLPQQHLSNRENHNRGLPGVASILNKQFMDNNDELVCLPLDVFHPAGDHAVIAFALAETEKKAFLASGHEVLPFHMFSSEIKDCPAIPVRFLDLSGGEIVPGVHGKQVHPLVMRETYWSQPVEGVQAIIVASTLPADASEVFDSYALIPEHFTGRHEQQFLPDNRDKLSQYFRKYKDQAEYSLKEPRWPAASTDRKVMERGSKFLSHEYEDFDPLRHLVKLRDGSIRRFFKELMYGDADVVSVETPHSSTPNISFEAARYKTTPRALNQLTWDKGLYRKQRRADGGKVNAEGGSRK
ncbi:unnamed protein product [Zymoseptoria tritici ST99CH_3D1]|nr:unnamed protein product [Zymoseptoria tritici ST99CH_3D1]